MPAKVSNPRDAFLLALGELLFIERMLAFEAMPEMLSQVADTDLSSVLAEHLVATKQHVSNVEQAFKAAQAEASSNHSPPFVALKEQHAKLAENTIAPALADVLHAHAALLVEHYEIGAYTTVIARAQAAAPDAGAPLEENLSSEQQAQAGLQELLPTLISRASNLSAGVQR